MPFSFPLRGYWVVSSWLLEPEELWHIMDWINVYGTNVEYVRKCVFTSWKDQSSHKPWLATSVGDGLWDWHSVALSLFLNIITNKLGACGGGVLKLRHLSWQSSRGIGSLLKASNKVQGDWGGGGGGFWRRSHHFHTEGCKWLTEQGCNARQDVELRDDKRSFQVLRTSVKAT